jgi:ADP-ribosylglycohydrolase
MKHVSICTSDSDPIRVDFVPPGDLPGVGRLGLTIAPGKRDPARGWARDLATDLRRLRDSYRADVLVSLLEESEQSRFGIADLLDAARNHGLTVRSLPIRDVSIPRPSQLEDVRALVIDVLAALDANQTVVIHCRGGLGRSGLLAAAVLIGRGVTADDAIRVIRAARPGAIETTEQEDWVRAFSLAQRTKLKIPTGPRTKRSAKTKKKRVLHDPPPGAQVIDARHIDIDAIGPPHPPYDPPPGAQVIDARHIDIDAIGPPHPPSPDAPPLDRLVGCLLGGAVGDALGYPVEFISSHAEIAARFGTEPPRTLAYTGGGGKISDDTQMTLFVAEGLIRANQRNQERGMCDSHAVGMYALLRWYSTQGGALRKWPGWLVLERRLHARRAPGQTNLAALAARSKEDPPTRDPAENDSKGCGAVMRAAPFGFLRHRPEAFESAVVNARLTHGHPTGALSAGYLASLVFDLSHGVELPTACDHASRLLATLPDHEETAAAVERARILATNHHHVDGPLLERLGGGWIAEEALAIALACVLTHRADEPRAVEATLWRAASHGGDSDSTASIAGNLLGAMLGADSLPASWLADLELRDVIERVARDLWSSTYEGSFLDTDDYPPN